MDLYFLIFTLLLKITITQPICKENTNNCIKCNPITNLCIYCSRDIYIPDLNGGCIGNQKCTIGKNYCNECDNEKKLCKTCETGFYPDENGACSYTNNCLISEKGICITCKENYILIGSNKEVYKTCKYLYTEDFKNCKEIDIYTGFCKNCEDGFFLNSVDKKCIKTENCAESSYGICTLCKNEYYLNKKNDSCIKKNEDFLNCLETIDEKFCEKCEKGYYFTQDEKKYCVEINYCKKGFNNTCDECIENHYLGYENKSCMFDENCLNGDKDTGLCNFCPEKFYLDLNDRQCKTNQIINQFLNCKEAKNNLCISCQVNFYLGTDSKCSNSKYCAKSFNNTCEKCTQGYFLSEQNKKCSTVENCLFLGDYYCNECIGDYYYNKNKSLCIESDENYTHCKSTNYNGTNCAECKDGFYISQLDFLCYDNTQKGKFYKCKTSDENNENCEDCVKDYYLGDKDFLCSKIEGCSISENETTCKECQDYYCLDLNKNLCIDYNDIYENESYYYRCNYTNDKGDECEICDEGLELNNGICVNKKDCEEFDSNGDCLKCVLEKQKEDETNYLCLNDIFGCVETGVRNCLQCNDFYNFYNCTQCHDGYKINFFGYCDAIPKEEENEEEEEEEEDFY